MGTIEQFGSNTAVHEEGTAAFDLFDAMFENGMVDMETYDQNFAQLVEYFGARVFTYGGYSGTVADMIACPPFQDKVEAGFDAAVAWLEAHDGQGDGDAEESDDEDTPAEDALFGLEVESQSAELPPRAENTPVQSESEAHKEDTKHEVERETLHSIVHDERPAQATKTEDRSDSAEESAPIGMSPQLEDVRQEIAEVFAEIENGDDCGEVSAIEAETLAIDDDTQYARLPESRPSDTEAPLREGVVEDVAIVSTYDAQPNLDYRDEGALLRGGVVSRHDEVIERAELPKEVATPEDAGATTGPLIELGVPVEVVGARQEEVLNVASAESAFLSSEAEIEVEPDEPDVVLDLEESNDDTVCEISAYDSVLAEDVPEVDDVLVLVPEERTYADVLDIEMREDETLVEADIVGGELPVFIEQGQRAVIGELQPEARVEVYAAAARAEQAATNLMQATTEAECHEAREVMVEEIMTLLELLGYDSPREAMAEILKTYDIGELRELLQHFLSANRIATGKGHDWLSRVSSYIAAHAILVHNYETLERAA